jgi:heparanase 1
MLAPAYLRLGGSEADRIRYAFGDPGERDSKNRERSPEYRAELSVERWDELCEFADATGLELMVTLNAGAGPRGRDGSWDPENARALVSHAAERGQPVSAWELGNEVNGFVFIHGLASRVSARQYAADFALFHAMVRELDPGARTAGPAGAYWPLLGEVMPFMGRFVRHARRAPDVITWHYYPQQSSRGVLATRRADPFAILKPHRLDTAARWARRVAHHARRLQRRAARRGSECGDGDGEMPEIWLGETGHALYGGEKGVSDRFIAGLWWMDQLGLMARSGVHAVMRQSLVGGDYGLLHPQSLEPRPDYWGSLLWKALMGDDVYAVEVGHGRWRRGRRRRGRCGRGRNLRVYAHRARHRPEVVSVLIINLDRRKAAPVLLDTGSFGFTPHHLEVFMVEAPTPLSATLYINGIEPELGPAPGAPPAEPVIRDPMEEVTVPPLSYCFAVVVG